MYRAITTVLFMHPTAARRGQKHQEQVQAPALRLCLQHCPTLLLQVGNSNRGKEETVGGDVWKFRGSLS